MYIWYIAKDTPLFVFILITKTFIFTLKRIHHEKISFFIAHIADVTKCSMNKKSSRRKRQGEEKAVFKSVQI